MQDHKIQFSYWDQQWQELSSDGGDWLKGQRFPPYQAVVLHWKKGHTFRYVFTILSLMKIAPGYGCSVT